MVLKKKFPKPALFFLDDKREESEQSDEGHVFCIHLPHIIKIYIWYEERSINHLNSRGCQVKIGQKIKISFCKRLKSKQHHVKVPRERFHLNGHTKGFRPQTRKLEAPCKRLNGAFTLVTFIMHKEY